MNPFDFRRSELLFRQSEHTVHERFERAVPNGQISGLGLGLFISHQIIELHGGSISLESTLGEGSTFTVRLPLASI